MSTGNSHDAQIAAYQREWEIAAVRWSQVGSLLDQGWEPFAVVQREPNSSTHMTEATVYLRRRVEYP